MSSTKLRAGVTVAACVAVGAAGGIAGSAAAPKKKQSRQSTTTTTTTTGTTPAAPPPFKGPGFGGPGHHLGAGGPAVHSEAVVLNKAGDAYITVTSDNGVVKELSGRDLTVTEGTTKVPYKDVALTIPEAATVYRNGDKATLGDLKAKDIVHVSQSSDGTVVFAVDPSFRPKRDGRGFRGNGRRRGPGGPGGRGFFGPPPANG